MLTLGRPDRGGHSTHRQGASALNCRGRCQRFSACTRRDRYRSDRRAAPCPPLCPLGSTSPCSPSPRGAPPPCPRAGPSLLGRSAPAGDRRRRAPTPPPPPCPCTFRRPL